MLIEFCVWMWGIIMAKGTNQKLKLIYLMKIMLEKTDDKHGLSLAEIITELERYEVTAERKSLLDMMQKPVR